MAKYMEKEVSISVFGMVQGVFFRNATQRKARELAITGWVRNEPDGSVKILAQGKEGNLQKLIEWRRIGPPFAKIDNIEVRWEEKQKGFKNFKIEN